MGNQKETSKGGGAVAVAILGVVALLFSGGLGILPGKGLGFLPGDSEQETAVENDNNSSQNSDEQEEKDVPSTIIISITEDKVTINGHSVEDEDELRKYVEDYNSDNRTFILEEDHSILETYNWVNEVFTALDIELKNSQ